MNATINAEMQRIYDQYGQLLPDTVVKEASDPTNPLHGRFTWDDGDAASRWRRAEASELIRRAKITFTQEPERVVKVRAFVSVLNDGERSYLPTRMALADHRDQVLEQALRDLTAMRKRYEALIDFDEVLRIALGQAEAA